MDKPKSITVVAAVFRRHSTALNQTQVLIFRRTSERSCAGLWEFPGGKVEPFESECQALHREIQEELGISVKVGKFVGESIHCYSTKSIRLRAYFILSDLQNVSFQLTDHDAFAWVGPQEIQQYAMAPADIPLLSLVFQSD